MVNDFVYETVVHITKNRYQNMPLTCFENKRLKSTLKKEDCITYMQDFDDLVFKCATLHFYVVINKSKKRFA